MSFEEKKYLVVKNVLNTETVSLLQIQTQMLENVMCYNYNTIPALFPFGDKQTKNSFSYYGALFTDSLLLLLQPIMEQSIGRKLLPTYSYMRIYYKDGALEKHTDRPSCEFSATLCIKCDGETPWPIFFQDPTGKEVSLTLKEGDMCIYKGDELPHWREPCQYDKHIQFFLHYVDANGKYSDFKFDKRPLLGVQK
jgi:hypothetical protein